MAKKERYSGQRGGRDTGPWLFAGVAVGLSGIWAAADALYKNANALKKIPSTDRPPRSNDFGDGRRVEPKKGADEQSSRYAREDDRRYDDEDDDDNDFDEPPRGGAPGKAPNYDPDRVHKAPNAYGVEDSGKVPPAGVNPDWDDDGFNPRNGIDDWQEAGAAGLFGMAVVLIVIGGILSFSSRDQRFATA